jgi:urease accessory protein
VFLNTSGGLTGGDQLSYQLDLGPDTHATATTQTAERAYAASSGSATVRAGFRVGAGGHLDWLPQETILFDGASLERVTTVDLAPDATCLLLESVILGRRAMGETLARIAFHDRRIIWQGGRLVHLEPTTLTDDTLDHRAALLGPARAFASIVAIGPEAPDKLAALRGVLDEAGVVCGASALHHRLCLRLMAEDALALRRQLLRALAVLRAGAPLPRVWQI